MRVLHTSDWHLGQKLLYNDRHEEHRIALDWLLETIRRERVAVLVVAGDVFDQQNPPNAARKLYYQFLAKLLRTDCRHVVITGGNHDSPSMLNAPGELLDALNIRVIGAATPNIEDEIVELRHPETDALEMVVAAVPFLRDVDLRRSIAGESSLARIERIRQGLLEHYQTLAERMQHYAQADVPVWATGHLYARGTLADAGQNNIYIGDKENIGGEDFPPLFDYVALGHIHRPQLVGGREDVRYSGSLIPLSFSETEDKKLVYLLDYAGKELRAPCRAIYFENPRRLKIVTGTLDYVKTRLQQLHDDYRDKLRPWVEVNVQSDTHLPSLDTQLRRYCENLHLELLKTRLQLPQTAAMDEFSQQDLQDLRYEDVFKQRLRSGNVTDTDAAELLGTFRELDNWMREEK